MITIKVEPENEPVWEENIIERATIPERQATHSLLPLEDEGKKICKIFTREK